jgi:hypothetical protein
LENSKTFADKNVCGKATKQFHDNLEMKKTPNNRIRHSSDETRLLNLKTRLVDDKIKLVLSSQVLFGRLRGFHNTSAEVGRVNHGRANSQAGTNCSAVLQKKVVGRRLRKSLPIRFSAVVILRLTLAEGIPSATFALSKFKIEILTQGILNSTVGSRRINKERV